MKFHHFFIACGIILLGSGCGPNLKKIEILNEDGKLMQIYQIDKDSLKQDWAQTFDNEGNQLSKEFYVDGELNGERKMFYTDGSVEIEEQYKEGKLSGRYTSYHSNGNAKFEANYEEDILLGITKLYYESGELREEVNFENSEENGPFREYFPNGNLKWEGTYLNGENEIGELKQYDIQGTLIKKLFCDSLHVCQTIWTLEKGDITPKKLHEPD